MVKLKIPVIAMAGIILINCTAVKQIQPISKIVDGVTLYKQVPDTIRISGNTLIFNNWHNAKVVVYINPVYSED
jgi:hypothetical protein